MIDDHSPAGDGGTGRTAGRVLFVSAGMGAGHDQCAAELARRIRDTGSEAEVVDFLAIAGRPGKALQVTYRKLLQSAPWMYGAAMRTWQYFPRSMQALISTGAGAFDRALRTEILRYQPDLVVSTYNLASQSLGRLLRRQQLSAPAATFVVDPGAHPYWVSTAIRDHFAPLPSTAKRLRRYGADRVQHVAPAVRPEFTRSVSKAHARRAVGYPNDDTVVVVNAGSWAAGHTASTVERLRTARDLTVTVVCGRNEQLAAKLRSACPDVRALPWTPDLAMHLHAADVVVDNAGGLTCWEALACGTPVILFDVLPGHGRLNAETLDRAKLAKWIRQPAELTSAVRQAARNGTSPASRHVLTADEPAKAILKLVNPLDHRSMTPPS